MGASGKDTCVGMQGSLSRVGLYFRSKHTLWIWTDLASDLDSAALMHSV